MEIFKSQHSSQMYWRSELSDAMVSIAFLNISASKIPAVAGLV